MSNISVTFFDYLEETVGKCADQYSSSFEGHYDSIPWLDRELEVCFEETRIKLGSDLTLDDCIILDKGRDLHLLQSVVGDDEHNTTDSYALGPCIIGFGPKINGIKNSWKDTGISHIVGNYAEGWILSPPSAEASFEVVNRRHARNGVPFTLDPVKMKLLSPVRKQSPTWELDLESKIAHLAEIAAWADKSWFTYDYHQMTLILANVIFDFEDARSFPFLYKTEGGSGGCPPYGNLETVYSAMHYYTRGKSRRALVGVMEEAVAVNTGNLSPKDTFFLRSSHLANMGDNIWLKYESAYRSLMKTGSLTASETNDLLAVTEGSTLPPEILAFGTEINPDSYVVGSAISQLRKDGLLMSEIDVKVALDAKTRELAVMGDKPIGILNTEISDSQVAFKSNHLKILSELSISSPGIQEHLNSRRLLIPELPDDAFRDVLFSYYRLRSESHATYSSFFYTDTVRVFKTAEIADYLNRSASGIRADISKTESFPESWRTKFLEENSEEAKRRERITDWINSKPLGDLLSKPLPSGIGTDDARIARSVIEAIQSNSLEGLDAVAIVLFSGDRQLARTTALLCRPYLRIPLMMYSIDKSAYLAICLDGLAEWSDLKSRGHKAAGILPSIRRGGQAISYYNYLLKRNWYLPDHAISQMMDLSGCLGPRGKYSILAHVEYDYPNMERGLDLLKYQPNTNTVQEYGGGFLERRTLQGFGADGCWSKIDYDTIQSWPDFELNRTKRHYRRNRYVQRHHLMVVDPMTPTTYSKVDQWRANTFPGLAEEVSPSRLRRAVASP